MNDLTFDRPLGERGSALMRSDTTSASDGPTPVVMLLRVVKRRKWLLLGSIVVAALIGLVITMLMTPMYTASATLEIQRETNRIVEVRGVQQESGPSDLEFYQTQYGLLKAESLAERVASNMRLHQNAAFFEMFGEEAIASELSERPGGANPGRRQELTQRAADILLANINVAPTRQSRLVNVEFTSADPAFSAAVVNAWTRDFVEMTLARRFEATSYARRFLEQRLEQLRRRLEESERNLVQYAAQQRIVNIPSTVTSGGEAGLTTTERSLVAENLAAYNQALNEAVAERTAAESRLQFAGGGRTSEALQNQALTTLRGRRAELAGERARLLTQFEADYPPVQSIQNQVRELDRAIAQEEGRIRSVLQGTFDSARVREASLRARVEQLKSDLINLRGRTIQYNIYQRDVDTNRQLYDALLQRYREIGVAGGVGVNNISVVDQAQVPDRPSSPRLILNLLVALLVGGMVGVGAALALEQIDEAVSDPNDVERLLGLPLLGTVPKSQGNPQTELEDPKSALVEAYLSNQTSLAFTTDHGIPRTMTVSSTRPGEGKTTTSYALARSLARTGRRVVLIDADMRSPSLHGLVGLPNDRGLSNYLAGDADVQSMVHRGLAGGMALITAGPLPPNAAELLTGDHIARLSRTLLESFDHVVFDAPPVMGLADAPLIASQVEGVVFVLESHETRTSIAKVAIGRLHDAHARVLGVLLTKFEAKRAHYGYGYEYGYGYGEAANKPA